MQAALAATRPTRQRTARSAAPMVEPQETPAPSKASKVGKAGKAPEAKVSPSDLMPDEVMRLLRNTLSPESQRRIQAHHAVVYQAIASFATDVPDVIRIYKELVDKHGGMVMSRLYRSLKVLEEAKLIERHWIADAGRVRSGYSVAGRALKPAHGHVLCERCGSELPES